MLWDNRCTMHCATGALLQQSSFSELVLRGTDRRSSLNPVKNFRQRAMHNSVWCCRSTAGTGMSELRGACLEKDMRASTVQMHLPAAALFGFGVSR